MREYRKLREEHPEARSKTKWVLYRNYPEKGKRTILDKVFIDRFRSVEEELLPRWTLTERTKKIGEYDCKMAATTFYGRKWEVWYAPAISIPYGPWLLSGLPGVVVEAVDETFSHTFQLLRFEQRRTPIIYQLGDYFEATREQVLKQQSYFSEHNSEYIENSSVGSQMGDQGASRILPFNPLRR